MLQSNKLSLFLFFFLFAQLCLAQNPDCTLTVPPMPLTATGLATPYFLAGFNQANNGACNMLNPAQTAFVQGAVFDQTNAQIFVYNPVVVDVGTAPAIAPVIPTLPAQSVVGLWFGFNGNRLFLVDNGGSLAQGVCTNAAGADFSVFGEYCYCNAIAFFAAANAAIQFQGLAIPANGVGRDGMPCPTLRDYTAIDQDQSDQVSTTYLVANGLIAQDTPQNRVNLGINQANQQAGANFLANPSDNRLINTLLGGALNCVPWMVPDLAAKGQGTVSLIPSVPTSELFAAANQKPPIALVPLNDPMAKVVGATQQDLNKVNAYRLGVNQPLANNALSADAQNYCLRFYNLAPPRIMLDKPFTNLAGTSPAPALANTLFGFLVARANAAVAPGNLNCAAFNLPAPFTFNTDAAGVLMEDTVALNPAAQIVNPPIRLTGNAMLDILHGNGDLVGAAPAGAGVVNVDCTLTVPTLPLTAQGLATPYLLGGFNAQVAGVCNQLNPGQTAFVQGCIYDVGNNIPYVYNPLVIDAGTAPQIPPILPLLRPNSVVGLWFGFNGRNLVLLNDAQTGRSLQQGHCTNGGGTDGSVFGEYAYCNAIAFFQIVEQAVAFGLLQIPPLPTGRDGMPCPTLRDFTMVDQDPSDQVSTTYLVHPQTQQLAQDTPINRGLMGIGANEINPTVVKQNPSDNRLLSFFLAQALNCPPWLVTDLAAASQATVGGVAAQLPIYVQGVNVAGGLNGVGWAEVYANHRQPAPQALIPLNDPMAKVGGAAIMDLPKVNAYRLGVNQPLALFQASASALNFCLRLYNLQPPRLLLDQPFTQRIPSPAPANSVTLFGFLVQRLNAAVAVDNLNCTGILGIQGLPFIANTNAAGQIDEATIVLNQAARVVNLNPARLQLTGVAAIDFAQGNGDFVAAPQTAVTQTGVFNAGGFNGQWFGIGFVSATGGAMLMAGVILLTRVKTTAPGFLTTS